MRSRIGPNRDEQNLRRLLNVFFCVIKEDEVNGVHVVVFSDESDPEGCEFLQMVKEIAQFHVESKELSMVWADPDDFSLVCYGCSNTCFRLLVNPFL